MTFSGVVGHGEYPADWKELSHRAKIQAQWRCVRCDHEHDVETHYVLTVHHWDGNKSNCEWWNLMALCQRCHLRIQAHSNPTQPYMLDHTDWAKPYAAGFYAKKYLGELLTREQVMARFDELLALEGV
jgi:5-methylcytosine-specific restriction endonuclease McrA